MTDQQKAALLIRSDNFIIKLQNATYEDTDLLQVIDDMIYLLVSRLEYQDKLQWENTLNDIKDNDNITNKNEQENFRQLVNELLKLIDKYKEFIRGDGGKYMC